MFPFLFHVFPNKKEQQQQCTTPDRKRGACIDLRECPSLFNLIRKPNLSIAERNHLRNSQCAYYSYPWVKFIHSFILSFLFLSLFANLRNLTNLCFFFLLSNILARCIHF